jgi:proteasome lid subunit RPN8/RPN11
MFDHVRACLPEEACGMVGGQADGPVLYAEAVLPVTNELHSPVRFRMAPLEQLQAFQRLEERGLDLVALFHSHPAGPDRPSPTDLAEFAYPGVLTLIWSRTVPGADWQLRGFWIDGGRVADVPVERGPEV